MEEHFGTLGSKDCAQYLATLYLQDLSDFIRATVCEEFEIVKYGEQLAVALFVLQLCFDHFVAFGGNAFKFCF